MNQSKAIRSCILPVSRKSFNLPYKVASQASCQEQFRRKNSARLELPPSYMYHIHVPPSQTRFVKTLGLDKRHIYSSTNRQITAEKGIYASLPCCRLSARNSCKRPETTSTDSEYILWSLYMQAIVPRADILKSSPRSKWAD